MSEQRTDPYSLPGDGNAAPSTPNPGTPNATAPKRPDPDTRLRADPLVRMDDHGFREPPPDEGGQLHGS